jgi:general secretion pathway protein G
MTGRQQIESPRRGAARRTGFSLVEVMVVVAIISMLAGAVAIKVVDYMDKARVKRARVDIAAIVGAIDTHYATHGDYPTEAQGLKVLPLKSHSDPWGQAYIYNRPGEQGPFEVVSYGADKRKGGEGINADIYSWQIEQDQGE